MCISERRVNGVLAVSRALGDRAFKEKPILGPENQAVTANPDFVIRKRTPEDQFLVVACDGIWDVKTNDSCVEYLSEKLKKQGGLQSWHDMTEPVQEMLDDITADDLRYPTNGGTADNCSCIVVYFNKQLKEPVQRDVPAPDSPQRWREEPDYWPRGNDEEKY